MSTTQTITLVSGLVTAIKSNNILRARGIPYAHASRFQEPQPIPSRPSSQILNCTTPAPICPQTRSRLEFITGYLEAGHPQSEDCLNLSVTAPLDAKDVPVVLFFHGGAFVSGAGDLNAYSGAELSRQENLVVVSVTTRLSIFGYQRIPGYAPANLGLLDQIAALKWVQRNISGFGGDPANVTITGQSAGGDSVFALLLAEPAKGLFRSAIIQSAPFGRFDDKSRHAVVEATANHAAKFLDAHANASTEQLLELRIELEIVKKKVAPASALTFGTEYGQYPLPSEDKIDQILKERAKEVDIMVGYTRDEGTAFAALNPDSGRDAEFFSKSVFTEGSERYYEVVRSVTSRARIYEFNWRPEAGQYGAAHCIELACLLGGWDGWKHAPMLGGESAKNVIEDLGKGVKALWGAFARGQLYDEGERIIIDQDFEFKA